MRSWVLREWGDNVKKAFDKQEIQRPWDRRSFLKAIGVLGVSAVGAAAHQAETAPPPSPAVLAAISSATVSTRA